MLQGLVRVVQELEGQVPSTSAPQWTPIGDSISFLMMSVGLWSDGDLGTVPTSYIMSYEVNMTSCITLAAKANVISHDI